MNYQRWPGDDDYLVNADGSVSMDGVIYHPHPNGGGLVAETAKVDASAFVGVGARVDDNARVLDNACVRDNACVAGNARVFGNACVYANARVFGDALVFGDAWVYGNARVFGNAFVSGNACVFGDVCVSGNAHVYDGLYRSGEISEDNGRPGEAWDAVVQAIGKFDSVGEIGQIAVLNGCFQEAFSHAFGSAAAAEWMYRLRTPRSGTGGSAAGGPADPPDGEQPGAAP